MSVRKHDVEMLRVRLDEMIEIYEVVDAEPEPSPKWKRLTTEFDDGISAVSRALATLQILVQLGKIK